MDAVGLTAETLHDRSEWANLLLADFDMETRFRLVAMRLVRAISLSLEQIEAWPYTF